MLKENLLKESEKIKEIFLNRKGSERYPNCEMGYIRADYNYHWWNTCFRVHKEHETEPLVKEFNDICNMFFDEFPDLRSVRKFCYDGNAEFISDDEYNVYLEMEHGLYWFRFILRIGDYNLYLHCYSKEAAAKEQEVEEE